MINRTKCYLQPILNTYPNLFKTELVKHDFDIYVGDMHYYRTRDFDRLLFLKSLYNKDLVKVSREIKWFHDEYPFDLKDQYILVFRIPEDYYHSYDHFLKGEYSKMYSKKQLNETRIPQILNGKMNAIYCVLTHNVLAYPSYKKAIEETYGSTDIPENPEEYDIPPRLRREFLNAIGNEEFIKSICPLRNL